MRFDSGPLSPCCSPASRRLRTRNSNYRIRCPLNPSSVQVVTLEACKRRPRSAGPACSPGSNPGEISGGESVSQADDCSMAAVACGGLRAIAQSTDLASHERFSSASGKASIEMCEGLEIQTPCPSGTQNRSHSFCGGKLPSAETSSAKLPGRGSPRTREFSDSSPPRAYALRLGDTVRSFMLKSQISVTPSFEAIFVDENPEVVNALACAFGRSFSEAIRFVPGNIFSCGARDSRVANQLRRRHECRVRFAIADDVSAPGKPRRNISTSDLQNDYLSGQSSGSRPVKHNIRSSSSRRRFVRVGIWLA